MHFFPITGGYLCAGSGQSLRVQSDHALCRGTSLLMIYDAICVAISMANIFARFLFHLEQIVPLLRFQPKG